MKGRFRGWSRNTPRTRRPRSTLRRQGPGAAGSGRARLIRQPRGDLAGVAVQPEGGDSPGEAEPAALQAQSWVPQPHRTQGAQAPHSPGVETSQSPDTFLGVEAKGLGVCSDGTELPPSPVPSPCNASWAWGLRDREATESHQSSARGGSGSSQPSPTEGGRGQPCQVCRRDGQE